LVSFYKTGGLMPLLSCCQLSLLWCGCEMMKAGVTLCILLYGM